MKRILSIILIVSFILVGKVSAQTATATASASEEKDIKVFKDKIANVIKKTNKALSGFVISNNGSIIKIKDVNNVAYEIKLDNELTKYFKISGASKKEIKADDISKDDYIIVTGVLTDKSVAANSIFIDESYLVGSGKITEVDKDNYSIKIINSAKETFALDIENSTKQTMLNTKSLAIEQMGFSKIKEGDYVHFVVKRGVNANKDNKYSAEKILIIPQEYFIK
jgi:hypothetical protein